LPARPTVEDWLHEATELFWKRFSNLVNETVTGAPISLRDELRMRIGEKTSVYGVSDKMYDV
jgi:hypothetical protein